MAKDSSVEQMLQTSGNQFEIHVKENSRSSSILAEMIYNYLD